MEAKMEYQWIPVTERLPSEWTEYLVIIKGASRPTTLYYDPKRDIWYEIDEGIYHVSHWMPLPAMPKEV